jgi:hypothetical protein
MPGFKCLRIVYEGTTSAMDPMRRLLVDIYCACRGGSNLKPENVSKYPKDFLLELALEALKGKQIAPKPLTFNMNEYLEKEEKKEAESAAKAGEGAGK